MIENETLIWGPLQAWATAFNDCDAEKAAALYAPDAMLWGTVSTALVSTPEGIREYFKQAFTAGTPPTVAIGKLFLARTQGEFAMCSGTYTFTVDIQGQPRSLPARFSFAYRKAGQGWLVLSHHSSLMPASITAITEVLPGR